MDWFEIWMRIRIFVLIWVVGLAVLVLSSIIKYRSFIGKVLVNNAWALFNGIMPIVIIIGGILWIIRAVVFRR